MVDRLKKFMEVHNLLPSQFADAVGIPRSTFSQMTGRNKTIKSEAISKIHATYPNLSINWLLFGEGDMLLSGESSSVEESHRQGEIFFTENDIFATEGTDVVVEAKDFESNNQKSEIKTSPIPHVDLPISPLEVTHQPSRRITKIMVFYNDNTFESFITE